MKEVEQQLGMAVEAPGYGILPERQLKAIMTISGSGSQFAYGNECQHQEHSTSYEPGIQRF